MPSLAISPQTVIDRVVALLTPLEGTAKVADRPGLSPAWKEKPRTGQAFVEVTIRAITERAYQIGPAGWESLTLAVDTFLPVSTENPNSALQMWALMKAQRDTLRANPTSGDLTTGAKVLVLPQVPLIEVVTFRDGEKEVLCHHWRVEWQVDRVFDYTAT